MQSKTTLMKTTGLIAMLLAAGSVWAQSATTVYAVSYYEVVAANQATSAQSAPAAIFANYKQAASKESGAVSIDVLSDQGRPNHFTMIEVWNDQDAYTRHLAAASAKQLTSAVTPWLAGPKDERLYSKFQ